CIGNVDDSGLLLARIEKRQEINQDFLRVGLVHEGKISHLKRTMFARVAHFEIDIKQVVRWGRFRFGNDVYYPKVNWAFGGFDSIFSNNTCRKVFTDEIPGLHGLKHIELLPRCWQKLLADLGYG